MRGRWVARSTALFLVLACSRPWPLPRARAQETAGPTSDAGAAASDMPPDAALADAEGPPPSSSTLDAAVESLETPVAPVSAPAVASPTATAAAAAPAVEVTVHGTASNKAQRTRESSQAVNVVELATANQQSADLGEVLARAQGINVRRQNGLGSNARFSLNGLQDDQIRITLDDVPLELAGLSQGLANIPLLSLDRVVIYRGVVPIRFGADALGGLINLVSDTPADDLGVSASYQVGSFGTQRGAASFHRVDPDTGLSTRIDVFGDYARNDYAMDAPVGDDYRIERVERFHDRYRALGGAAEIGVVKRPWAQRLSLRAFGMYLDKQLQHSPFDITVPYGEARYDRSNYGATLRYEQPLARGLRLQALLGYSYQPTRFDDDSRWIYDWYGTRVRTDPNPGETGPKAIEQTIVDHQSFARLLLTYRPREGHKLELVLAPLHTFRTGEDHTIESGRDPLSDRRQLLSWVSGLAYELNLFDDVLENTLFGKSYLYHTRADDTAPNGVTQNRDASVNRFGGGDALRVRLTPFLYGKLSYELATRLPRPFEVFGDGVLVQPNLDLKEETSHNGNLELTLDSQTARAGRFRASANGFVRKVHDQIVRIGFQRADTRYENVYRATSRGVEGNAGWTSPHDYLELDGNATYFDLRNDSTSGTFGMYEGDRIPNRPYLLANATARSAWRALFTQNDEISLTWYTRYVHSFFRFWESAGAVDTKATVPTQWSHSVVLGYQITLRELALSASVECQNLTDAELYDEFGIPRPGRAYYSKLTLRY
jgi:vitamin B12 transporter